MQPILGAQCSNCEKLDGYAKEKENWYCKAFPDGTPREYRFDEKPCPKREAIEEAEAVNAVGPAPGPSADKNMERFVWHEGEIQFSLCGTCIHKHLMVATCDAYPNGIPQPFLDGSEKHTVPVLGDQGIHYERVP